MHIDGSFDMENAPAARGYFFGDYQGLTAIGQDFLASYSQIRSLSGFSLVAGIRRSPRSLIAEPHEPLLGAGGQE